MKIYVISDLHLVAPGRSILGMDPTQRLQWAFDDLASNHADADLCVLLGDLADQAEPEAYLTLRRMMAAFRTPMVALIGNHDNRATYRAAMPEAELDGDGFAQSVRDTPLGRLIFLDTVEAGHETGHLCARRLSWLAGRLEEARGRPVFLFMHHPPFEVGTKVDELKLADSEALAGLIARHGQVRYICAGHTHRICGGTWHGTAFSNLGSITINTGLHLLDAPGSSRRFGESVSVGVMLISPTQVVLHQHDVNPYRAPLPVGLFGREREIYARGGVEKPGQAGG